MQMVNGLGDINFLSSENFQLYGIIYTWNHDYNHTNCPVALDLHFDPAGFPTGGGVPSP